MVCRFVWKRVSRANLVKYGRECFDSAANSAIKETSNHGGWGVATRPQSPIGGWTPQPVTRVGGLRWGGEIIKNREDISPLMIQSSIPRCIK